VPTLAYAGQETVPHHTVRDSHYCRNFNNIEGFFLNFLSKESLFLKGSICFSQFVATYILVKFSP